jgi:hypothetical protein
MSILNARPTTKINAKSRNFAELANQHTLSRLTIKSSKLSFIFSKSTEEGNEPKFERKKGRTQLTGLEATPPMRPAR